jgi:hypothetical protein
MSTPWPNATTMILSPALALSSASTSMTSAWAAPVSPSVAPSRSRTAPSPMPTILAICFGTAGIGLGMMNCVMSVPFSLQAASAALIAGGTIFE